METLIPGRIPVPTGSAALIVVLEDLLKGEKPRPPRITEICDFL